MGFLVLETGSIFQGNNLSGYEKAGEIVFNTSHSGYEEIATDPSYFSQIIVMTAPMQGNYGESDEIWQSDRIWIDGFVCLKMQSSLREHSWAKKLKTYKIPLLEEVDTRNLTLLLRDHGSVYGAIVEASSEEEAQKKAQEMIKKSRSKTKDWPYLISKTKVEMIKGKKPESNLKLAVIDYGCKKNIVNELALRCCEVGIFPPRTPAEELRKWNPDGILLSNGPGDPAFVYSDNVRDLMGEYFMFGICMGSQILARVLGGVTKKLLFGHRGANHPVKDIWNDRVYVTSQNHGYCVIKESLPKDIKITHINLNDQTVQGFMSEERKIMAVQFHPENHPGPEDSLFLFDKFIDFASEFKKTSKTL